MEPEPAPRDTTGEMGLSTLLTRDTIRAKMTAANWEQATEMVGSLLVEAGQVEPGYIESMKRVLHEMGPYAVIAPGIVLLHARPEDGVLKPCLGLVTLSTPVEFGHSENDPVDLVFALGARDKEAHILALQQLAEMLSDESAVASLRAAADSEELYKVIAVWAA